MAPIVRKIDSGPSTIGELLRRPISYRVPVYQRDFAWTSEQIDALLDDLQGALNDERSEYFLGAVVISHTEDDKKRDIVDGQQRLTAMSMIFAAIAKKWSELGDERRSIGVSRDYLGSEDRRSGLTIPKLTLNENNDFYFQNIVINDQTFPAAERKVWSHTNKLLVEAYGRVKAWLVNVLASDTDKADKLFELEDFIAGKVNVIVIEAGDEADAFITFETLNDRGLDLAISDLVKNFLFSKAGRNHIDRFKVYWSEVVLRVGGENVTQFLRYFWNAEYETSRERDLYKSIKDTIKSVTAARQMIERLRNAAELYAALSNPEHVYWSDFPNEYRNHLEALLLFKVTQYRPVALAAMMKFKPNQTTQLLRMLVVFSFRYTVISALNTGNLDKVYSKAALGIQGGSITTLKEVFEALKPLYVEDDRFQTDFQQRLFAKDDVARYVLKEINTHLERDLEHVPSEREGRLTLEHIFPKSPKDHWKDVMPEDKELAEFVYLIGNLTLLERGKNRNSGNLGFAEKKAQAFTTSTLAINQEVAASPQWTLAEIEKRSAKFARIARAVWRVDY